MFERFTERARQAVVLAQDEARALKHDYLGTEHILLGLLREEEDGVAARVLASVGITHEEVRAQVIGIVGQGDEIMSGQIPFTAHAKKVLELALREARSLGHNYIGTEHILLALVRENESRAAEILGEVDAGADKIREEVIRIGGPSPRQTDEGVPPGKYSGIEPELRRVVPVAQRMSDGTWVLSVEVWDHGLVMHGWRSERWPMRVPDAPARLDMHGWRVSDDLGTSYRPVGGSGAGTPLSGFRFHVEFAPAPPPEATSLRIRHEALDNELSVSLTD